MLSKVNDRSLSHYITLYHICAFRLSVSPPLRCWATISDSTGTATGSRDRGGTFSRSQHGRQAAGHRRGADRAATTSRRPSAHSRIMVIMRTPSAAGRPAAATSSPGGVSRDSPESAAAAGDPAGTPPLFQVGSVFLSAIAY